MMRRGSAPRARPFIIVGFDGNPYFSEEKYTTELGFSLPEFGSLIAQVR